MHFLYDFICSHLNVIRLPLKHGTRWLLTRTSDRAGPWPVLARPGVAGHGRQAAARPGPPQAGRAGVVARPGPVAGRLRVGRQNYMYVLNSCHFRT